MGFVFSMGECGVFGKDVLRFYRLGGFWGKVGELCRDVLVVWWVWEFEMRCWLVFVLRFNFRVSIHIDHLMLKRSVFKACGVFSTSDKYGFDGYPKR